MKHQGKLLLIFITTALLTACSGLEEKKVYDFYKDKEFVEMQPVEYSMEDQKNVTSDNMTSHFQQFYGWSHLVDQKLYWNGKDEVQLELTFSKDSDLWEIEAANKYVIDTFIIGKINNNLLHDYQIWAQGKEVNKVFAQIYIGDKVITQEYFEKNGSGFDHLYYETQEILLDKQKYEPENKKDFEKDLITQLPKGKRNITYREDLSQTCIIVSVNTFSQVDPDNLKAIEDIVSTMTEADKSVLMELYFEDELYYQTIINKQDNEKERKRVAEEVLTNLFTSDTERYNRYINQVHHDCNPVLCMKNEKNFMDHSHTEEYLKLYEKYCTQNCLKNMGREHLFTYVDYLASLSEKVVQCINIKPNRINEGEDEYSFEAVLKEADSNQQIKEYSVTGKITFLDDESNDPQINSIIFFDYTALGKYIAGYDVFNVDPVEITE